jgi:hypothetical protein
VKELLLAVLVAGPAWAGAWSQAKGHYYTKSSGIFYRADEVFDEMGRRRALGMDRDRFEAAQGFFYLEYGLRERLTLLTQLSGGQLRAQSDLLQKQTTGIGDLELGLKYQWVGRPVVVSPHLSLKLPTGYHRVYDPPLGTGRADLEARLLLGRSLFPLPLYLGAEAGYRRRGGPFSDQAVYVLEVGGSRQRVFAKVYAEGRETLSGRQESSGEVGVFQVSEGDYRKVGANLALNLAGSLWADLLFEGIFAGENIGAGRSWGLGLAYRH